jgi:MFS transporter, PHS family, inorganic phosphate transporter
MLATVFYAQPIGQLVACITAVVATASLRHSISGDAGPTHCGEECLNAMDKIWRWIVGFGAIPPAFAVLLRFYIPESPRYLLEVEGDPIGIDAADYSRNKYYADPLLDEEKGDDDPGTGNDHHEITNAEGLGENRFGHHPRSEEIPPAPSGSLAPSRSIAVDSLDETEGIENLPKLKPTAPHDLLFKTPEEVEVTAYQVTLDKASTENGPVSQDPLEQASSHGQDNHTNNAHPVQVHRPCKESWKAFWRGFRVYLFTERQWTRQRLWLCLRLSMEMHRKR